MKSVIKVFLMLLLSVLIFTTCDNSIGLGPKVNTEKPVIKTPDDADNKPGAFLQGSGNKIYLDVEQEFGIARVYMEVEFDYTDYDDPNFPNGALKKGTTIIDAEYDEVKKQYYVELDTKTAKLFDKENGTFIKNADGTYKMVTMEDGSIKAWVTAIDVDGNKTTTTDIVYFVKNTPPQIKLNMPSIADNDFDNDAFLNGLADSDPLFLGFELLGLATDNSGIEDGYPKIMIWPADNPSIPVDKDGIPKDKNGEPLPQDYEDELFDQIDGGLYGTWRSLVPVAHKLGTTAKKFSWPMQRLVADSDPKYLGGYRLPKDNEPRIYLSQGRYRIRIVTKDSFGNLNFYPNRVDHGPNKASKRYIEINYIASDIPIVQVTTYPQYYNAANDFTVHFLVSCTNELAAVNPVAAYITNGNDGFEKEIGGPYYPTQLTYSNSPYQFTLTITPEQAKAWKSPDEGTLFVRLTAQDKNEKAGPPTYQHFQYDVTPPKVPIDRPVALTNIKAEGILNGGSYTIYYPSTETPKWVTGNITVGGINTDDNGIKEVYYHIGKIGDDFSPASYWSEHYNDNYDEIKNTGIWKDTKLNTPSPDKGWGGSVYAWTYTASYPIGFKKGNLDLIQELNELNGYIAGSNYETAYDGSERFYLPFYVKVVDNAANFHIIHYKLCVDPLMDEPQITIAYPNEGATVGGTLRLSGSATDNYWMHTVLIRVTKEGTPGYYVPTTTPSTQLFYLNPDGTPNLKPGSNYLTFPKPKVGGFETTEGWFKATKTGDDVTVSWSYSLNQDRGLDPPKDAPDGFLQDVKIEVVAIDTNEISHQTPHIAGPVAALNVKFSSKVPTIEDLKIIKDNVDPVPLASVGTKTSGKFKISMEISAMQGFNSVRARINNLTSSDRNIIINNSVQSLPTEWKVTPQPPSGDRVNYLLTIDVDSTSSTSNVIPKAINYGTTGSMKLELTLEDNTENHFSTTGTWDIGIDNFYPTAEIKTSKIALGNFLVEGKAQDWATGSGDILGLERVLVYIEKAKIQGQGSSRTVFGTGTYLRPDGTTADDSSEWTTYPNVIDRSKGYAGSDPNVLNFINFPKLEQKTVVIESQSTQVWTSKVALVVDYQELSPDADYDKDGTNGEMWNGPLDKDWGGRLSTPGKFSDGPYMVHYIIMDQAGNASHYTKDIFIENNKPVIKSINIGTDIDFNGHVDNWVSQDNPGEYRQNVTIINLDSSYNNIEKVSQDVFRIRNNKFGIRLELGGGNGEKHVAVSYVDNNTTVEAKDMIRGYVYEIVSDDKSTDFRKHGAPNNTEGTVFIASSEGEGTAKVKVFAPVGSFRQEFKNLGIGDLTEYITFQRFGTPPGLTIPDGNDIQFIVKVYDSALSLDLDGVDDDFEQPAHALLLKVAVNNDDTVPPTIDVADFGQKYVTEPGLNMTDDSKKLLTNLSAAVYSDYVETTTKDEKGDKLGYVQYQAHSQTPDPITRANISGKVIFNGKAADNHRINKITVQIPGYNSGNELAIAERNNTSGQLEPANTNTSREFRIVYPAVKQYSLEYGHALTWQFMWDSSTVTNSTASNINITFRVYDDKSATPSATTSIKNVNIVPYITKIETPLSKAYASSPSAFNRSALGGYPIREDESITIHGFSLGTFTTNSGTNSVTIGSQDITISATGRTSTTINATIPANTASGPLVVKVSGNDSFNNKSNKSASYNQEPNNINNNVLDNGRYVYVWKTGYLMNQYISSGIKSPIFRMGNDGRRYMTFGSYDTMSRWRVMVDNDNYGSNGLEEAGNRFINLALAVDQAGSWYAAGSNMTNTDTGSGPSFNFLARTHQGRTVSTNYSTSQYKRRILLMNNNSTVNSDRVRIPRIYAYNTNGTAIGTDAKVTRIFMSYYDGNSNDFPVVFRYGTVGATPAANVAATDNNYSFGGNFGYNYDTAHNANDGGTSAWGSFGGTTTATMNNYRQIVADKDTKYKGGEYTAVGGLSNGRPVIAWYTNDEQLVFSYGSGKATGTAHSVTSTSANTAIVITDKGTSTTPAANTWQGNAVVIDTNKGTHVDMAVDGADNVHLAYYDPANGGLYYAYIPASGAVGDEIPNTTAIQKVPVDTYLAVGTKIMINVRQEGLNYVPYITYFHGSFTETKNSIRVAWRKDFSSGTVPHGTNTDNTFTGKWEVMTVPASGVPVAGEFICNGVPTASTSWTDPNNGQNNGIGALSRGPTTPTDLRVDLSKSIVVGYMTNQYYEGAMLNANMSTGLSAK